VVNATPRPLCLLEIPGTHCMGDWMGSRVGPDWYRKSRPHRDSNPGPSSPKKAVIPTELYQSTCYSTTFAQYRLMSLMSVYFRCDRRFDC